MIKALLETLRRRPVEPSLCAFCGKPILDRGITVEHVFTPKKRLHRDCLPGYIGAQAANLPEKPAP
jgi:hypothetical protein